MAGHVNYRCARCGGVRVSSNPDAGSHTVCAVCTLAESHPLPPLPASSRRRQPIRRGVRR